MYRDPWLVVRDNLRPPVETNYSLDEIRSEADRTRWNLAHAVDMLPRRVPMLLGVDIIEYGPGTVDHYNSAALISRVRPRSAPTYRSSGMSRTSTSRRRQNF
jgi:hypothetical protein